MAKTLILAVKETYFEMDRKTNKMVSKNREIGEV
jgi:hypothetical protein